MYRLLLLLFLSVLFVPKSVLAVTRCPEFLNVEMKLLNSKKTLNICQSYSGKPLLIVNIASDCAYTPQLGELEKVNKAFRKKGLVILGFSSHDFMMGKKSEKEIAKVCFANYGVTFTLFAPVKVIGESAHPIFQELALQSTEPSWNFNKYLLTSGGKVLMYFDSTVEPKSIAMAQAIQSLLQQGNHQ